MTPMTGSLPCVCYAVYGIIFLFLIFAAGHKHTTPPGPQLKSKLRVDITAFTTALLYAAGKIRVVARFPALRRSQRPEFTSCCHGRNAAFCSRRPQKQKSAAPSCAIETNRVFRL
jgi:hypothetical protein